MREIFQVWFEEDNDVKIYQTLKHSYSCPVCGFKLPKAAKIVPSPENTSVPVRALRRVVCLCLLISAKKVGGEVWIVTVVALRAAPACGRCQSSANVSKKPGGTSLAPRLLLLVLAISTASLPTAQFYYICPICTRQMLWAIVPFWFLVNSLVILSK